MIKRLNKHIIFLLVFEMNEWLRYEIRMRDRELEGGGVFATD
jgi:hypothetical protein